MKRILIFFLFATVWVACKNDKNEKKEPTAADSANLKVSVDPDMPADPASLTSIEWLDPIVQNLGSLTKDQTIEISYRFRNTGSKNLIIENVSAQCGCTIPEKPEKPFAPGEEGVIKAKFNGTGSGTITKEIYVKANTSPATDHTLSFTGEIKEK